MGVVFYERGTPVPLVGAAAPDASEMPSGEGASSEPSVNTFMLCAPTERIFIELIMSDRKFKASREGSK